MISRWIRFACLGLTLLVVLAPCWAEDEKSPETLTIVGRKDGSFLVVERNGTKKEVAASSLTLGARVKERVLKEREARADRFAEQRKAAAEEAAAQRAAEEAARKEAAEEAAKRAARAKRRAEALQERQAEIWNNYETKHHAYGPNSVPEVKLDDESAQPAPKKSTSSGEQ